MSHKYIPHALMLGAVVLVSMGYWLYMTDNRPVRYEAYEAPKAAAAAKATALDAEPYSGGLAYPDKSEMPEPPRLVVLDAKAVAQGFKPADVCLHAAQQIKDMPVSRFTPITITPVGAQPIRFLIPSYQYDIDVSYCPGMHRDDKTKQLLQNGNPVAFMQIPAKAQ